MEGTRARVCDETVAVLETVERFKKEYLEPLAARPEHIPSPEQFATIVEQAVRLGFVPTGEETGLGVWENACDGEGFQRTLRVLALLAESSSGISFHVHQLALGQYLSRRVRLSQERLAIPLFPDIAEMVRSKGSLLLWRENGAASSETEAGCVFLQTGEPWDALLIPEACNTGKRLSCQRLSWHLYRRDQLHLTQLSNSHGLDGTLTWQVACPNIQLTQPATRESLPDGDARQIVLEGLGMMSAGMLAIAHGAVQTAYNKALAYAETRVQGGKKIGEHAAIRLSLGYISASLGTVGRVLASFSRPPQNMQELVPFFQARIIAHPLLCQAANQALQIFGGYGYMQDQGLEQIVRDTNHLKLWMGTPSELQLFLAAQELGQWS